MRSASSSPSSLTSKLLKSDQLLSTHLSPSTGNRHVSNAALGLGLQRLVFTAEQPAPAPHLAHPEGCAALYIVLVTVPRVNLRLKDLDGPVTRVKEKQKKVSVGFAPSSRQAPPAHSLVSGFGIRVTGVGRGASTPMARGRST